MGLTGEVRSVPRIETRIKELQQLGYSKVITSKKSAQELKEKFKVEILGISKATELQDILFS